MFVLPRKIKALVPILSLLIVGCASSGKEFLYDHPEVNSGEILSLHNRISEIEKKYPENIHLETVATNTLSSHHLVVIRDKEPLHYHANHDGWAMALEGKGDLVLGEKTFAIRPGSSVFIPRGMRHKAINRGRKPLAAFVIFTPPYDGKDTIPVEEK